MLSGIYQITNKINERIYIGSAIDLKKRKAHHFSALKQNKHQNPYFQNDFKKICNSTDDLQFETIVECPKEHLILYEQIWLDHYYDHQINCYNICPIAGSPLGRKCSAESRKKMRASQIGKKRSDETRQKMSEAKRNMSSETKLKIREVNLGKKHSEETKLKMSDTQMTNKGNKRNLGKKHSDEAKLKMSLAAKKQWAMSKI